MIAINSGRDTVVKNKWTAEMQMWAEIAIEAEFDRDPLPPLDFEMPAAFDMDMFEEPANEIWNRR